jgi:hypothetical protein
MQILVIDDDTNPNCTECVMPKRKDEQWFLFDLDSSLADFETVMIEELVAMQQPEEPPLSTEHWYPNRLPDWLVARKDAIKKAHGFWLGLPPIKFGIELYHAAGQWGYERMILTKGPRRVVNAWTEKVQWCQKYVPEAGITITHDKGLVYGKVLYDDFPPYILRWLEWRPRGKVLMLDAPHNQGFKHPNVLRCFRSPLAEQADAIRGFLGISDPPEKHSTAAPVTPAVEDHEP